MASRLLVIDETPGIVELYQLLFASEGYEVFVAPSGVMNVVEIEQLKPDLILLASHLRVAQGEQPLLHQLTAYPPTSRLPLVLCTADDALVDEQHAFLQAHEVVVVLKPFEIKDLVGAVQQALQRRLSIEPPVAEAEHPSESWN